jgi:site-specific DNA recombinase
MTRIVAAYCRTACATERDPLSGVRLQEKEIRRYAKRHGQVITGTYAEAGVSGITLERPELQRLIADCRAGLIETVITKDPARLSRDSGQLLALLHIFQEARVDVEYSAPEAKNDFLFTVLCAVAEIEEAKRRMKLMHR